MIHYSENKSNFLNDAKTGKLIERLEKSFNEHYNGLNDPEENAWRNSVCKQMAKILSSPKIGDDIGVAVEFQIRSLNERVDMILSGKNKSGKTVIVIIELKQWSNENVSRADNADGLIVRGMQGIRIDPYDQLHSYRALLEFGIPEEYRENLEIYCIGYLHNYDRPKNVGDPLFRQEETNTAFFFKGRSEENKLVKKITELIPVGDECAGIHYIEDNYTGYSMSLRNEFENILKYTLSAEQMQILKTIERSIRAAENDGQKRVMLIRGGMGTGKSVVALYAAARFSDERSSAYYLSMNAAPRSVYNGIAVEFLMRSTDDFIKSHEGEPVLLTLVDESQRVSSRTRVRTRNGYRVVSGNNQIHDIIEDSCVSVFFIDESQIVSMFDAGTADRISGYCAVKGYQCIRSLELTAQFRCGYSDVYINRVNNLLDNGETEKPLCESGYSVKVFDDFGEFYEEIEELNSEDACAKIVAGECWDWNSRENFDARDFPDEMMGETLRWNKKERGRHWAITADRNQVGCIHTCQGLEFDYIGVIIGPDLVYDRITGKIKTNRAKRSGNDYTILKGQLSEANERLADKIIRNTYRVLLTRGLRGCRIYCANEDGTPNRDLAEYIRGRLQA